MASRGFTTGVVLLVLALIVMPGHVFGDANFDRLISAKNFKEALDYADDKIPMDKRTPAIWVKLGQANDAIGMTEKALACYMVSWRMNPDDYASLLGVAQIYNKLGQPENALSMAENALRKNFTAEASWEFAKACIALKRPADAKKALEKIIETDPNNLIANRELGNIYYDEGDYTKAVPLIRRSYRENADGEIAFKIGRAYMEIGVADSAMVYLKEAVNRKTNVSEASLYMARAQYRLKKYNDAVTEYGRVAKNQMSAIDHYNLAFSKEQMKDAAGALASYQEAIDAYGNDKSREALLARAFAARDQLSKKNAAAALTHLRFISAADDKSAIVNDIYFLLADAFVETKDNNSAISSLERAIALNSKNIEAYARLAELYEKSGQGERAKRTYERMMSISPNDPNVFLALGNYNNKEKRWAEAIPHFEKSAELRKSAAASEGLAVASFNMKNMAKAIEAARAAVALDANAWEARVVLTRALINNKNFKAAQEHAEFIVRKEPQNLEFLKMLALCYDDNKEPAKLAEADKQIVMFDKRDLPSRLRLARFAESKNDSKTAIAMYREIAALDSKNSESLKKLAHLLNKEKQGAEAAAFMRRYIALVPNDAEAHRDLGDMLYEQKNLDAALASYRTAIKIDPNLKGFHKRYAEIVIAKGQHAEVITALNAVIKNGDADVSTYATLGMIYNGRKQFKEAQEMYTKALSLDPTNLDALSALAASQAAAGDINSAIITYEQAVMMNQDAGREYKELGDLYTRQKKDSEALRAYMRYLDKVPTDVSIANNVGRLLFAEKKYAEAVKYLAMVKSNDPAFVLMYAEACVNSGKANEALPVLEELRGRRPRVANIATVLRLLGEAYEKDEKQHQKAGQVFAEYVALPNIKDQDAAYKAAFLQEKAAPAAAMRIYDANTKAYPDDMRNFLRLGLMLSQKKETAARALPLLQRCTAAAGSIPTIWLELAKVYGSMNRDNDELDAYQKYVRTDPQHVEANQRIGALLMRKGDMNNAMVHLEIANTVSPNNPSVMMMLARGYMRSNRTKEAIDILERAKRARPDDANIRFQLYELYVQTNQTSKANEEIRQLVSVNKDTRYMLLYGESLIAQKKEKEADAIVEDILSNDPDNTDAMMLKAKILRVGRKWAEADEIYKEITDILPSHAAAYFERAETIMQARGSLPRAEALYNRALRADPKLALAHLGLARIFKQQKKNDDYKKHLDAAQKLDPDNALILEEVRRGGR
ncbi:MAG: tetratricopeptide repeat protein [Chitinispirillales bacterium]|jgi:tetratricopeptide (TPR) repeat protein|nr:tetratricopeptide repeat protein [Chitinispirillales bacterium]